MLDISVPQIATSREVRSLESSYVRARVIDRALKPLSETTYLPFASLQRLFYSMDWGDGIVAEAIKGSISTSME
jgi:hypothetical protein